MTIVSDARDGQPRIDGTDVTIIDVYQAYARQGMEPAEVADDLDIDLARVHEAIAYYYDHASFLRERTREEVTEITGDGDFGFETPPMDEFARENQDADEL